MSRKEQVALAMEAKPTLWVAKYGIKNEEGLPVELDSDHRFMRQILNDLSPLQVILKAPQVGMTVAEVIKTMWIAKKKHKDIIYTLPTDKDVKDMAGGKVNRIVAQNPILKEWVKEHDTVEQKTVGDNIIYYRGTWTAKQAMMVSSKLNVHDEVDASNQNVITQYETRLQASDDGWRWYFSHPSLSGYGVDKYWQISDQKHWFVKCECGKEQYMSWPESVNINKKIYQCKYCGKELSDNVRRYGRWVSKYKKSEHRPFSGYWISQLICAWIPASKIIRDFKEKSEDYFYNFVLGLPYVGGGNQLTKDALMTNLVDGKITPGPHDRVIIGVDTGLNLDYVMGTQHGLFYHGDTKEYKTLDEYMKRWAKAIVIMDAGGDLIGSRAFQERWPGRVFLCYLGADRKKDELVQWDEESGKTVQADRNRCIQLLVDEFSDTRIPLYGNENDWYDYWLDWANLTRIKVYDTVTNELKSTKWVRSGRDHRALATVFWRIGIMRFSDSGSIIKPGQRESTVDPLTQFDWDSLSVKKDDWRRMGG